MGLDISSEVLERAARSPKGVKWTDDNGEVVILAPLSLTDDIDAFDDDSTFEVRLDYAASTIYYSALSVFSGGGYSEKVGDVQKSQSGYTVTQADRDRFKMLADDLRKKHGIEVEESEESGMFDATFLRQGGFGLWS